MFDIKLAEDGSRISSIETILLFKRFECPSTAVEDEPVTVGLLERFTDGVSAALWSQDSLTCQSTITALVDV